MLPAGTNTMELQSGSTTGRAEPQIRQNGRRPRSDER